MTPSDAYARDDTFRHLVDGWAADLRCPYPLSDRCLELDMPLPAACARWAADPVLTPDLPWWTVATDGTIVYAPRRGPYPALLPPDKWFWVTVGPDDYRLGSMCLYLPERACRRPVNCTTDYFPNPVAALLCLLDVWKCTNHDDRRGRVVGKKKARRT